jgi:branched-chain amino acid transport system ATP-binding protein
LILEVEGLTVGYGRVLAVNDISLRVASGTAVAVIGANGAGKTTLLRGLVGLLPRAAGSVRYDQSDTSGRATHRLVADGMVLVPQDRGTIAPLSVEDNLRLGGYRRSKGQVRESLAEIYDMFPILWQRRHVRAGLLSGGEQQMLAFGRALASRPRLLLLDEPSTGLSPLMAGSIFDSIGKVSDLGISVLIAEQNVAEVFKVARHIYVLDRGSIVLEGTADELRTNGEIRRAFIGM